MGTNFYIAQDPCEHCGRGGENIHIGKRSGGWKFLFARFQEIDTSSKWFAFIEKSDGKIRDEYGAPISAASMIDEIKGLQSSLLTGLNCYTECGCSYSCREREAKGLFFEHLDDDGYRISHHHDFS